MSSETCRIELAGGPSESAQLARYVSLTQWRGVACLCVVIFHSVRVGYQALERPEFLQHHGFLWFTYATFCRLWIGVPLFFVISGYCITCSALDLRDRKIGGAVFLKRRFRRIYPPYWIWIAMVALLVSVVYWMMPDLFSPYSVPHPFTLTTSQWAGNLTLTEAWRAHAVGGGTSFFWGPAWTLCYEEQFYAVVAIVLLVMPRFFFSSLVVITALVSAQLFLFPGWQSHVSGFFFDGRWFMFAAGILVFYLVNKVGRRQWVWYCIPLGFAIMWHLIDSNHLFQLSEDPSQAYFYAYAFALLILILHRWDSRLNAAKILRPFRFCGEMCYSLYLVHWPMIFVVGKLCEKLGIRSAAGILFGTIPLTLLICLVLARAFHRMIERRFWNPKFSSSARSGTTGPSRVTEYATK